MIRLNWARRCPSTVCPCRGHEIALGQDWETIDFQLDDCALERGEAATPNLVRRYGPVCTEVFGGESGIRTHETLTSLHAFQASAFNHSAISPSGLEAAHYTHPRSERNVTLK